MKVYHAPPSRSVRVVWLLDELGLPYELQSAPLEPTVPKPLAQKTPSGKIPTIEDGDTTMFESGAILEYVLFTGLGNIIWHTRFKEDGESVADALADYRSWAEASLDALERQLADEPFLLGQDFSGADIMVGCSILVAKALGLIGDADAAVDAYVARLTVRPALRRALQV